MTLPGVSEHFPILATGSLNHTTHIVKLPKFFMTSSLGEYYAVPSEQFLKSKSHVYYLTNADLTLRSYVHDPSCTSSLYQNNETAIKTFCRFRLIRQSLKPQITLLGGGAMLLLLLLRTAESEFVLVYRFAPSVCASVRNFNLRTLIRESSNIVGRLTSRLLGSGVS